MKKRHVLAAIMTAAMAVSALSGCTAANSAPTTAAAKEAAAPAESKADAAPAAEAGSGTWPNGAVQLLVPSKAGGVTDIYTRNIQNYLQSATNGNFATVNYDNETVGYENLRSAKADGSTLLFQHSTMICKYLTGAIDYNPQDSFRVVGVAANMGSQAIICGPDAPYNTWAEFIKYAKANPGQVTTAISTNGTTHFIFGQVQQNCAVELNMVECSSEADKLTNVAGGIIDVANCSLGNAKEYETAGKLKVLGVLGSGQPEANYPEWEPITDVIWESYIYTFAPAEMDDATAEAVNTALKGIPENAAYCEAVEKIGGTAMYLTVKEAQKHFDDTMASLSEVAAGLGINIR